MQEAPESGQGPSICHGIARIHAHSVSFDPSSGGCRPGTVIPGRLGVVRRPADPRHWYCLYATYATLRKREAPAAVAQC